MPGALCQEHDIIQNTCYPSRATCLRSPHQTPGPHSPYTHVCTQNTTTTVHQIFKRQITNAGSLGLAKASVLHHIVLAGLPRNCGRSSSSPHVACHAEYRCAGILSVKRHGPHKKLVAASCQPSLRAAAGGLRRWTIARAGTSAGASNEETGAAPEEGPGPRASTRGSTSTTTSTPPTTLLIGDDMTKVIHCILGSVAIYKHYTITIVVHMHFFSRYSNTSM